MSEPGSVSYMQDIDPTPTIELFENDLSKVQDLIDLLDEHEDVVSVWTNLKQ